MRTDFRLVGLGRTKSMTCEPMDKEEIFWPKVGLTQDRFDALWEFFTLLKPMQMIAEIEHEGFYEDGTPREAVVVAVRELNT